jgi:hypothetical protein
VGRLGYWGSGASSHEDNRCAKELSGEQKQGELVVKQGRLA